MSPDQALRIQASATRVLLADPLTADGRRAWDLAVRRFRATLRRSGLFVHSVSWGQGGYPGPGGEVASIEYRDEAEADHILETLSPANGMTITRITPTRIFVGQPNDENLTTVNRSPKEQS